VAPSRPALLPPPGVAGAAEAPPRPALLPPPVVAGAADASPKPALLPPPGIAGAAEAPPRLTLVPFNSFEVDLFPGNFQTFPKLAQHAADFKEYEYVQLIFVYKSTLATNWSTNEVTTGKIIMATQMDVNRPSWTTYDELASQENKTEGLVTGVSDEDRMHTHGVECDPKFLTKKGLKFVRTKGLTGNADKADYDLGRTSFGIFGTGANLADRMIGELWVQYKVHFKNHRMYSMLGYNIPQKLSTRNIRTAIVPNSNTFTPPDGYAEIPVASLTDETLLKWWNPMRQCDFNNMDVELVPSIGINQQLSSSSNYAYAHGWNLTFTFPSNLRGDYEIELHLHSPAASLAGNPTATGSASADSSLVPVTLPLPITTGTALLNHDIPTQDFQEYETWSQKAMTSNFSATTSQIKFHAHLGQAVSTEENSFTVFFPLCYTTTSVTSIQQGLALAIADPSYSLVLGSNQVRISQYNACQEIGTAGFPYSAQNE
jgi:hypothetical protein